MILVEIHKLNFVKIPINTDETLTCDVVRICIKKEPSAVTQTLLQQRGF